MKAREEYFARVRPLIGEGLRRSLVALEDLSLTGGVLELLAACQLERALLRGAARAERERLDRHLRWKNGFVRFRWLERGRPELTIAGRLLPAGAAPRVSWDRARRRVCLQVPEGDLWSYQNLCYAVARRVRDLLLGRADWPAGDVYHGTRDWPFAEARAPLPPPLPTPARLPRPAHLLLIGCGSVGSELARLLAGSGARWTLCDAGRVSPFNPSRQWFGSAEVGQLKVRALAKRLRPARVRTLPLRLGAELAPLERLLEEDPPDAALLATGTADHGPLARLLFQRGVPHLAACAYPRARYFEVALMLPGEGTPCLDCFRGHLYRGLETAPPLEDELSHHLYCELSGEARERALVELVAEPATRIETARIAAVAGQCLVELLRPPAERSPWVGRLLAAGTTCLLGGNVVERVGEEHAYGITYPGQVVRLGLENVADVERERVCPSCGRRLEVRHSLALPAADDEAIDRALLT